MITDLPEFESLFESSRLQFEPILDPSGPTSQCLLKLWDDILDEPVLLGTDLMFAIEQSLELPIPVVQPVVQQQIPVDQPVVQQPTTGVQPVVQQSIQRAIPSVQQPMPEVHNAELIPQTRGKKPKKSRGAASPANGNDQNLEQMKALNDQRREANLVSARKSRANAKTYLEGLEKSVDTQRALNINLAQLTEELAKETLILKDNLSKVMQQYTSLVPLFANSVLLKLTEEQGPRSDAYLSDKPLNLDFRKK